MNLYFYEVTQANFDRYVAEIVRRIIAATEQPHLFFIQDTFIPGGLHLPKDVASDVRVVPVGDLTGTILRNPPDVFVCFSHRLPDVYWTYWFRSCGAKTAQVQHGLYSDFFPKSVAGFLSNPRRKIRYVRYLLGLAGSPLRSRATTIASVLRKDFLFTTTKAWIDEDLMSDRIFIWGDYWEDWYRNRLFYDSDRVAFTTSGSFDHPILKDPDNLLVDRAGIGYICQTLVEDGRMKRGMFKQFLDRLFELAEGADTTLYIRPHPRTDLTLYKRLFAHPRVQVTRRFPYTGRYVGHYSGMLSICFREDARVVLVHFPGHDLPEHFRGLAFGHRSYLDRLDMAMFEGEAEEPTADASGYWKETDDPYAIIADGLVKMALE